MDLTVFGAANHLHLLLWNRFNADHHQQALEFINDLLKATAGNNVLCMLRPTGRPASEYEDYRTNKFTETASWHFPPAIDRGGRPSYCELWLQTATPVDNFVRQAVVEFSEQRKPDFYYYMQRRDNPAWEPLGASASLCQYTQIEGNDELARCFADLESEQKALLLKYIWARATPLLSDHAFRNGTLTLLDLKQPPTIASAMESILSDFDLRDCGLSDASLIVDPTEVAVSHLTAIALDAYTTILPTKYGEIYNIEHAYGFPPNGDESMTRPFRPNFASKGEFLNHVRRARFLHS